MLNKHGESVFPTDDSDKDDKVFFIEYETTNDGVFHNRMISAQSGDDAEEELMDFYNNQDIGIRILTTEVVLG
jgi:hypothetical protein